MATSGSAVDIFARAIAGSGTTSSAWTNRAQQVSFHQGTLTRVDPFNGIVDFQLPDPSAPVVPAVKYIQTYSAINLPSIGDVVHIVHTGTDVVVLGQHLSLNGFVLM